MPVIAHDRLVSRHVFETSLVTTTALHLGAGKVSDGISPSDMPIMRNGAGQPYVPGSSFRGSLRSALEALLRGLGVEPRVCDPFRKADKVQQETDLHPETGCSHRIAFVRRQQKNLVQLDEDAAFALNHGRTCPICGLFGHSFFASRIGIPDLVLEGETTTYTRNGVGLDRDLRSASTNVLYNFEAVPANTKFKLRLDLENGEPHELGLLLVGLDLFAQGLAGLGGKKARGLGGLKLDPPTVTRWTAEDFFTNGQGTALDEPALGTLRAAAAEHYLAKGAA